MRSTLRGIGRVWIVVAAALWIGHADAAPSKGMAADTKTKDTPEAAATTPSPSASASEDSSMTIRGGQSGKEFRSMTIEGEDRVHVDFGRPELNMDLDPEDVPGLTRGTALDVLDRTVPVLSTPLVALSSQDRSPYVA